MDDHSWTLLLRMFGSGWGKKCSFIHILRRSSKCIASDPDSRKTVRLGVYFGYRGIFSGHFMRRVADAGALAT